MCPAVEISLSAITLIPGESSIVTGRSLESNRMKRFSVPDQSQVLHSPLANVAPVALGDGTLTKHLHLVKLIIVNSSFPSLYCIAYSLPITTPICKEHVQEKERMNVVCLFFRQNSSPLGSGWGSSWYVGRLAPHPGTSSQSSPST